MKNSSPKNSAESKRIIKLMIDNEHSFMRLYRHYSQMFQNQDFWLRLSGEENRHAQWLEALMKSKDVFSIRLNLLPEESLRLINEEIEEQIASQEYLTLAEALEKSLRFEESFFEKSYFEFISSETISVQRVIEDLKRETKEHIISVKKELENINQNSR
jgi:hypothetical protein